MKAFTLHFSYEFFAGLRNRTLLSMNYLMPIAFYGLMGGMMVELNPFLGEQLIPAMVVFAVLTSAIMGLPTPLVEARENEVLRSYRVNGVPAGSLLGIPSLSAVPHMLVVVAIVTASAPVLFQSELPTNWLAYLGVLAMFVFASCGLGSLIGVISANSRVAVLWQQLAYLPSILLGGLMIPAEVLPVAFVRIGHLLPASYAMQTFLGGAYGRETLYAPLWGGLVLLAGGLMAYGLAFYLFSWDSRNDERRAPVLWAALALVPYLIGALFLV